MTTLHDRLADLAEDAPPGGPAFDLWDRGVRRRRRRRAGAAVVAVVLVVLGIVGGVDLRRPSPDPADVPFRDLHIPRTGYPPSPWATGTDETGAPGPLALLSTGYRNHVDGWWGSTETLQPFGVSAVDGSAVFLDLPGARLDSLCCVGKLVLSPDGTKVGYVRYRGVNDHVVGFAVYDTVTGRTLRLTDPRLHVIRGADMNDLEFSGDSRYLETTYARNGSASSRQASLNVWDVTTGELVEAEPAGHYWMPNMGSGPAGIVWSRGQETYTFDTTTRRATAVRTSFRVVQASYGPDGRAFAAIAFGAKVKDPWKLYAGRSPETSRPIDLDIRAQEIVGWRGATHVVVRRWDGTAAQVDITTGRSVPLGLDTIGHQLMRPSYAADLWANPLVDGARPPGVHDPRLPWRIAGGLLAVALCTAWLRRRRRARV